MGRTKIEWCDYSLNPVKGLCKYACSYCYARKMYKRFKWNPEIRFGGAEYEFWKISKIKKSSRIFIGSMHDIFGEWIPNTWIEIIIEECRKYPQHTFLFLTKNPKRYASFEFPKNCWKGATITENPLFSIRENIYKLDFVSMEPLMKKINVLPAKIKWVIVGGLTQHGKPPHKKQWISDIVKHCRYRHIPIFIKSNAKYPIKIQQIPKWK